MADVNVVFSSSTILNIAPGDLVIAAGKLKGSQMTAFAIHNLSTNERRNSGVISNLFVAAFAAAFGLFGVIATAVFLPLFAYILLAFSAISIVYLLNRSFVTLTACVFIWYRRRHLTPEDGQSGTYADGKHPDRIRTSIPPRMTSTLDDKSKRIPSEEKPSYSLR